MKILLTTLNSKYIHSNLAIRYLKAYVGDIWKDISIKEFTINDKIDSVVAQIISESPDMICFSCYIWNINEILMIAETIKIIKPLCRILLGGPEVSYDGVSIMKENLSIDYIITGEGEKSFREMLMALKSNSDFSNIKGIIYRDFQNIIYNEGKNLIDNLDEIPWPYIDLSESIDNRIIYYETSRGCPYNCQYCLSSTTTGVRYFSLERVKEDIKRLVDSKTPLVKLVDRTFNCLPERAVEIFEYIISLKANTSFHFEIAGDLINDEMIKVLYKAPPGLFQFEIGVQTTNQDALNSIKRKSDIYLISDNVSKIKKKRNIHLHIDLIAGLPEEDYISFGKSFNDVYNMNPDRIQLGFLKLLKGSGLRQKSDIHGYAYLKYPPYEILFNKYITYEEICKLKGIEDLVEYYYNSQKFINTLQYLIRKNKNNPFVFFERLMEYWIEKGLNLISHKQHVLYEIILAFGLTIKDVNEIILKEKIRLDYVIQQKPIRYPEGLEPVCKEKYKQRIHDFYKKKENIEKYFSHLNHLTSKQIERRTHIEIFKFDVLDSGVEDFIEYKDVIMLFDYDVSNTLFDNSRMYKIMI